MHIRFITLLLFFLLLTDIKTLSQVAPKGDLSVMFYNTENLFDCFDDSLSTGDDEFLPTASRRWTFSRYKEKLSNVAKVIMAAGQWSPPTLIGLCEIENHSVMNQFCWWTGLGDAGYRYIHFESPDRRGIDVALLYQSKHFKPLKSYPSRVILPDQQPTRDILVVNGIVNQRDTVWILVNHWPSKRGESQPIGSQRLATALKFNDICDSIRQQNPQSLILTMGDFNDTPTDSSLLFLEQHQFINLAKPLAIKGLGSNKYKQQWSLIDQVLISESWKDWCVAKQVNPIFSIIDLPFLLEDDKTNLGNKPFRTFQGPVYHGGYSDHLPVMVTFKPLE